MKKLFTQDGEGTELARVIIAINERKKHTSWLGLLFPKSKQTELV